MALKVIGAGLGRTGTLSLKLALEHLGFGPCYHMSEVLAGVRRNLPLWLEAGRGRPDWDAIFGGFASTTDYPGCTYWRELAAYYPDAKVVLSTRDPNSWFDSVSNTIFHPDHLAAFIGAEMDEFSRGIIVDVFGDRIGDRAFMTDYFRRWEAEVTAALPAERLLVHRSKDGWEPLCAFLGVPVPAEPYPRVNSTEDMNATERPTEPPSAEMLEGFARAYINDAKTRAFGGS